MTVYYLSPFEHLKAISFSNAVYCRTNGGSVLVRPGGTEAQKLHSAPALSAGMAVSGRYAFWVDGSTGNPIIQRWDIIDDVYTDFDNPSPSLFVYNDVACDGTHLYAAGYDGSSSYVIEKWTLDGTRLWANVYSGYLGGAVSICANQLGFVITSNGTADLYDSDGTFIAALTVTNNITREWDICATRDRFWYGDTRKDGIFDDAVIRGVDITGAQKTYIDLAFQAPDEGWYAFAITEHNLFIFVDIDYDSTNTYAIVYDRTVTRDANGDIVTDVFDIPASRQFHTLTPNDYWYKACADAETFLNF